MAWTACGKSSGRLDRGQIGDGDAPGERAPTEQQQRGPVRQRQIRVRQDDGGIQCSGP
jgi:hypothetical protein